MRYEEFRRIWEDALREAALPVFGFSRETLDVRSMDRTFQIYVEPVGCQDAPPFTVTADLSWRWNALLSARTASTEEDLLTELLGRQAAVGIETDRPAMRLDVVLAATLPYGKSRPLPSESTWKKWVMEVRERLESIEPILSPEMTREGAHGRLEVLGWQGLPTVDVECGPEGELCFGGVKLAAFQMIELPRQWDDRERESDEYPARQLRELLGRVRSALHAWMESLDLLRVTAERD